MLNTLLSQTGTVGAGPTATFPGSDTIRIIQLNPQPGVGFSGVVVIEGTSVANPGNNDFVPLATATMNGQMFNLSLQIGSSVPYVRARITSSSVGAIAVFADSTSGTVSGSQSNGVATTTISSSLKVAAVGTNFKINAPVVASFSTDDVVNANNINQTLTDLLASKQDLLLGGSITASASDINVLAGAATAGVSTSSMTKLAGITATATQINYTSGVTSSIQTQLNNRVIGNGIDLTGLTATVTNLNKVAGLTVGSSTLNLLTGLTASGSDLNALAGTAGTVLAADLTKLGSVTATATELNKIHGFTGTSTDLNKVASMTCSVLDLNSITGLNATGVTATQLGFLNGLNTNVATALATIPSLSGLTAVAADVNLLTGAAGGTGTFTGKAITSTHLSYLYGLAGPISTSLAGKRNTSDTIGINEITSADITVTELNYLNGATSNIQSQLNALTLSAITASGGTFTGNIVAAAGAAATPSLVFTGATTSGFYKQGTGVGIAVGGVRVGSFDSASFILGDNATQTVAPALQYASPSVAAPAYSFQNDTDTGVYRVGTNAVGIAANGTNMATWDAGNSLVSIGGAASSNYSVSITGVFQGEKMLSRTTIAGGADGSTGLTTLYTVPTGRTLVVTKILLRLITVATFTDGTLMRMNIGTTASNYNELVDSVNNTSLYHPTYAWNTAGQVLPLGVGANAFPGISGSAGAGYGVISAGTVIKANLSVLQGAATFTFQVIMFGYEF